MDYSISFQKSAGSRLAVLMAALLLSVCVSTQGDVSFAAPQDQHLIKPRSISKEVSFETDDGWRVYGTLTLPEGLGEEEKVPAALLVHGNEHDQSVFDTYPGWAKIQESLATLRIDLRGKGKSRAPLASHFFTSLHRESIYLDVKAALALLRSQRNVDSERIGIVAEESAADAAVLGAAGVPNVRVMVFLSGRLGDRAKSYIEANDQIAVLAVVSKEDRASLNDMADVYSRSGNPESEIMIFDDLGIGAAMGSVWRDKFPDRKPIDFVLGEWLTGKLAELGARREVSFQSQDGYTLYADLVLPDLRDRNQKVPGAVLLHSALGDRHIYEEICHALAKNGIAALLLDWRGRGQSIEKGYYFDLPKGEREKMPLDVSAAINFLASQEPVDGNRIGIVGMVLSAKYGMMAAASDQRVKTFVVLTGFVPDDAERDAVSKLKIPVLYMLSEGRPRVTKAMMEHYLLTKPYGSQVLLHTGGAHGFHMLEKDESWGAMIVRWLADHLST